MHLLFFIGHLLMELVQKLIEFTLLLSGVSFGFLDLLIGVNTDSETEQELQEEDDTNGNGHRVHWNRGTDCLAFMCVICCGGCGGNGLNIL